MSPSRRHLTPRQADAYDLLLRRGLITTRVLAKLRVTARTLDRLTELGYATADHRSTGPDSWTVWRPVTLPAHQVARLSRFQRGMTPTAPARVVYGWNWRCTCGAIRQVNGTQREAMDTFRDHARHETQEARR